jgi:hypothetical protein
VLNSDIESFRRLSLRKFNCGTVKGEALRATNVHCQHRRQPRQQVESTPNTCASEIGPMSGSHNTDALVNEMLADMCGLIVKNDSPDPARSR